MRRNLSSYLSCSLCQFLSKFTFQAHSVLRAKKGEKKVGHLAAVERKRCLPVVVVAEVVPVLDQKFVHRGIHDLGVVRNHPAYGKSSAVRRVQLSSESPKELTRENVLVDPGVHLVDQRVANADRVQKKDAIVLQASSANLECEGNHLIPNRRSYAQRLTWKYSS